MSIEEVDKIDFISTDATRGEEELSISDHLDWSIPDEHLRLLQEKVYRYLDFVSSGELYRKRPEAKGRRLVIRIRAAHHLPSMAMSLLEKMRTVTLSEGVDLELRPPVDG